MKFRRKWKPKQKLRKADLPFLLAEYHLAKNTKNILVSLGISMLAITIATFAFYLNNPDTRLGNIIPIGLTGFFMFLIVAAVYESKASKIAKVLKIEERLKKYGIKTEE